MKRRSRRSSKEHGVGAQTIFAWRKHFGRLEPADVKRLRQLDQENARLKRLVAERDRDIEVLKEIATICSSVRRVLLIAPHVGGGAILLRFRWSKNGPARQYGTQLIA